MLHRYTSPISTLGFRLLRAVETRAAGDRELGCAFRAAKETGLANKDYDGFCPIVLAVEDRF